MFEEICIRGPGVMTSRYSGPERRDSTHGTARWLVRVLDEMDNGMLLLTPDGRLRHANRPARQELARSDALKLTGDRVHTIRLEQQGGFLAALSDANRGRRRLIMLGQGALLSAAVIPLEEGSLNTSHADTLVLMLLGKRQSGESLTLDFFASTHGLTSAEARVLQALCGGLRPKEIARQFDVAVSTVRTQITSIRHKTQAASIRALVERVSTLPPIASRVRAVLAH